MVASGLAWPFDDARQRALPWPVVASLALHIGLAALWLWGVPRTPLIATPPEPVTVTILSPAELAALLDPTPPVTETAPDVPAPPSAPAASEPLGDAPEARLPNTLTTPPMTVATELYAGALLASPGMAGIRRTMGTLAGSEQMIQLCNIEGLEQLRAALPDQEPDTLVPYALADMTQTGLTLVANGGAFRSRRRWFAVSFTCEAAQNLKSVTSFAFRVGDEIPQSEWDAHDLNAEDKAE